jgi:hypothetical protein
MKWTRNTSKAILFGLPAIVFMACASGTDDGKDDSAKGSNDNSSQEDTGAKGSSDDKADAAPKDAKGGVVGNWDILNKPQPKSEYGMFGTFNLKVRNNSDDADTPFLDVRLTNKAGDLVTAYTCAGDEIEPGQKATVQCFSTDDYAKWTDYEIKNSF